MEVGIMKGNKMKAIIGLDIGGSKILGALFTEDGKILTRCKKKSKASAGLDVVLGQIFKVVDQLLTFNSTIELLAIGAGAPGIVKKESVIEFSPNLPFRNFNLADAIIDRYGVPFVLANDVDTALLGEWKNGNNYNKKHVIGLFVGTGVGGAIIIDGELYVGASVAGELGHMIVKKGGARCGCGNRGCVEAYASKTGMQRKILKEIKKGKKTSFELEHNRMMKSSDLMEHYKEGDQLVVKVVDRAMEYIAVAIGNYINIFNPEVIILGGGVIESLDDDMIDHIIVEAQKVAMPSLNDSTIIQKASLGDDAGIIGAYELAKTFKIK